MSRKLQHDGEQQGEEEAKAQLAPWQGGGGKERRIPPQEWHWGLFSRVGVISRDHSKRKRRLQKNTTQVERFSLATLRESVAHFGGSRDCASCCVCRAGR